MRTIRYTAKPVSAAPSTPNPISCCVRQAFRLTSQSCLVNLATQATRRREMATAITTAQELEDGFLSATRKGQEIVLEAIKTWVDTIQAFTPELPAVNVPFADWLPQPEDVVSGAYDFAAQFLASQKRFTEELIKTAAPLLPAAN